jgi:hypothetical protein
VCKKLGAEQPPTPQSFNLSAHQAIKNCQGPKKLGKELTAPFAEKLLINLKGYKKTEVYLKQRETF